MSNDPAPSSVWPYRWHLASFFLDSAALLLYLNIFSLLRQVSIFSNETPICQKK